MGAVKNPISWKTVFELLAYDTPGIKVTADDIDFDSIHNLNDLLGTMLDMGMQEVKQFGFKKTYVTKHRELSKIKGKVDFPKSMNKGAMARGRLICKVGELDINNLYNQILKYAIHMLFRVRSSDRDEESEVLSRDIRLKLLVYEDILKFVDNIHNVDKSELNYIMTSAPFYYAKALNVAMYIINLYSTLNTDGVNRIGKVNDAMRCRTIFEKHLQVLIKEALKENDELRGFVFGPKVIRGAKGVKLPDIVIYNKKENKAISIDALWYDVRHHNTGSVTKEYSNEAYIEYIKDKMGVTDIKNCIVYPEKWDPCQLNAEYKSDMKFNWGANAYVFDMYLNRPLESYNKRFKAVLKGMVEVR